MADDDVESFLTGQPASQAPASPSASGAGNDELEAYLTGKPAAKATDQPTPAQGNVESFLTGQTATPTPKPGQPPRVEDVLSGAAPLPEKSLGETFGSGVARGAIGLANTPRALGAVYSALTGDIQSAKATLQEIKNEEAQNSEAQWSLDKIHNPSDFGHWVTEKLGEAAPATLAAALTGGLGATGAKALAGELVERGVISLSAAQKLAWAGSVAPIEIMNAGMMTAGEAEKQFAETGDINPKLVIGAGAAEGTLQTLVPAQISKGLLLSSASARTLASSLGWNVAKLATEQGAAQAAQEAVSQAVSAYSNPNYTFFGDGPWYTGPGPKAIMEAAASGFVVGGAFSAPFARAARQHAREAIDPDTGKPLQQPGNRQTYYVDPTSGELGPVTEARRAVLKDDLEDLPRQTLGAPDRENDAMGIRSQIEPKLQMESAKAAALDRMDARVPRYIEVLPDGKLGSRVMTDTELELQNVVNRPQSEKPRFIQVNPESLVPASMTAHVADLPKPGSDRIWFLPTVSEGKKVGLMAQYARLWPLVQEMQGLSLISAEGDRTLQDFKKNYDIMLNQGLRVLPSRGAGFYYTGPVDGPIVTGIKQTMRSSAVGWYNPETRVLSPFQEVGNMRYAEPGYRQPDGYPVSLDLNRIEPEAIQKNADGTITLLREPRPGDLIPGQGSLTFANGNYDALFTHKPTFVREAKVEVAEKDKNRPGVRQIVDISNKILPAVSSILRSVGIPLNLKIEVITGAFDKDPLAIAASAYLNQGKIVLKAQDILNDAIFLATDLDHRVMQIVMHEVGHFVTWHFYSKAPVEIQDQLHYAYNKALLGYRMDSMGSQRTGIAALTAFGSDPKTRPYHLSFTEWLAEQFRRWTISDERPLTRLDYTLSGISNRLEKFYDAWEAKFGTKQALDLRRPDYFFSGFMDYLHTLGDARLAITQLIKGRQLFDTGMDIIENPVSAVIAKHVRSAVESMAHIIPEPVKVLLNASLDPYIVPGMHLPVFGAAEARYISRANLIELAAASLRPESAFDDTRINVAHELIHVYTKMGLIHPDELRILYRDIDSGTDPAGPTVKKSLVAMVAQARRSNKVTPTETLMRDTLVQRLYREEQLAYYMQDYADIKIARSAEAKGVFDRIFDFMERLGNFLRGDGFQTREDVRNRFFNGEMVNRSTTWPAESELIGRSADSWKSMTQGIMEQERVAPDKTQEVDPGVTMKVKYIGGEERNAQGKLISKAATYSFENAAGEVVGGVHLRQRWNKGYELLGLKTAPNKLGLPIYALKMLNHVAKDVGIPLVNASDPSNQLIRLPAAVSAEGMPTYLRWLKAGKLFDVTNMRDLVQYYVFSAKDNSYYSPNFVKDNLNYYSILRVRARTPEERAALTEEVNKWKALKDQVPTAAWDDKRLEQMFNLRRNNDRDEAQGRIVQEGVGTNEREMQASMGSREPLAGTQDVFLGQHSALQEKSQIENAREYGLPVDMAAPDQMFTLGIRKTWEWLGHTGKGSVGNRPGVDKYLKNDKHEPDRIGHFTRLYWTIQQLAWRNEHLKGLQDYGNNGELMNQMGSRWLQRADDTAREWERVKSQPGGPQQMEAIAKALFDLTEMNYRLPVEVANKVVRHPANWADFLNKQPIARGSELDRLLKDVKPANREIIRRVATDFLDFLNEVEKVRDELLVRSFGRSPVQLANARASLQKEMAELRNKPYFPMVRFGEFTVTLRDPNDNNKVKAHYAYETQRQRDAAVPDIAKQWLGMDMTIGRLAPSDHDFMSLPGPLLRALKEKLFDRTGKTPEQLALIDQQLISMEEFEMTNSPDRTFRKRWMPNQSIPGYNTDAFRAYAHYFTSGSRYLGRLAYMDKLADSIRAVQNTVDRGLVGNTGKREMIVKYMRDHFNYIMEPGRDSGKLRAFASLWFLGFSPVAAFTNLLQVPQVFMPTISAHFGTLRALKTLGKVLDGIKLTAGSAVGDRSFTIAREEMKRQGRIDIGQAPELGAFAEGYNLMKLLSGGKGEKFWRGTSYYGMLMFQKAEQFNREVSFKTAWDLANANPNIKRMNEIELNKPHEVADLMSRLGLSHTQAVSFLFAREMVDRSQFQYSKFNDPGFMRSPMMKNLTIFFKYTQAMTYAFRFNGAMLQFALVNAALFGLNSMIPGMEDLNETLSAVGHKLFGQDWDLLHHMREYVAAITKGTMFERTGPWVAQHGISHFGFGLGLLPSGWGMPRFDASANGTVGRVVPGLADLMHGLANDQKTKDMIANGTEKMSGAGFGLMFSLFNYLTESPGTTDSKKWEALLPRQLHAMVRAYRYSSLPGGQGAETTAKGAKIVKFDAGDPDDIATVIAQALGFNPTKVTEKWEQMRDVADTVMTYNARRLALYAQFDKAIRSGNKEVQGDVLKAISEYNNEVGKIDPTMMIKTNELRQSMFQRMKARAFTEATGATDKRSFAIQQRLKDLYPGVDVREVK